ncbi:MAG: outer membrane lipoprotein carrier protein LolA [Bacteroidales bacterium]|jgi:outer membrane lipoprotein carrier protein|nr:outer membrane lipoprotein carrier protein LolA [Bacteroidales bacterium]
MKLYRHILLLIAITLAGTLNAQNKSQQILDDLANKTNAAQNIKVGFNYEMDNADADIHEVTEGSLIVSGDKYILKIAGQEIICDGKTIWTYISDAEEVQINEVDLDESFSPTKLFSSYSDDYDASLAKEFTENNRNYYLLQLKPKDKNSSFDYVHLQIDKDKMQISAFILYDFDDNVFSYIIKEYLTNVELGENAFSFDASKYPDVYVIDMR